MAARAPRSSIRSISPQRPAGSPPLRGLLLRRATPHKGWRSSRQWSPSVAFLRAGGAGRQHLRPPSGSGPRCGSARKSAPPRSSRMATCCRVRATATFRTAFRPATCRTATTRPLLPSHQPRQLRWGFRRPPSRLARRGPPPTRPLRPAPGRGRLRGRSARPSWSWTRCWNSDARHVEFRRAWADGRRACCGAAHSGCAAHGGDAAPPGWTGA